LENKGFTKVWVGCWNRQLSLDKSNISIDRW
jgi:hypothetical protein